LIFIKINLTLVRGLPTAARMETGLVKSQGIPIHSQENGIAFEAVIILEV
jgi:hypothetical protein